MTKVFESRKPEPYVKTSCKKCITPIEFLPEGQSVGQKVSVKCFACGQVETYPVTESTTRSMPNKPKTAPKTTKGSDEKPVSMEYYELLGISHTANGDEIKKAYRKMAIKYHPDKNPNDPTAEDKFKKLSEAYQVLADPKLRKRYNEVGEENGIRPDGGFVDPEDFFKQSFGGDRFVDIIGEISIGKDMKEALETTEEGEDDLSPEEKAAREVQKVEAEQERNLVRLKRVEVLCEKLIAKLDLYTPSTEKEFIETVKKEAEDLKFESHGVELLHAIGFIYNMKVNQYSSKKFAFGLGSMFHSVKEKSYIFSQTVGTLRSAYDLQSTFGELQKAEENGISEEEKAKLEETAAIKGLQAIWRGSKLEIESVLRDVCDEVLNDKKCSSEELSKRLHALRLIGNIYQSVMAEPEPAT